jgi:hypothetical protein
MRAFALSLSVLVASATPALASPGGVAVDGAGGAGVVVEPPGRTTLVTGLSIVGVGIMLSAASIAGGLWLADDRQRLAQAADAFRASPNEVSARAVVGVRDEVGSSEALAQRRDLAVAAFAAGAAAMAVGWIVAGLGAAGIGAQDAP